MSDAVFQEVLSIGIDTSAFNAQIEAAVAKYTAAMEKMSTAGNSAGNFGAAADQIKALSAAADGGASSFGRFGDALETAAIRVPARLIVFAALGAAIAAIAEPIRLVSEGFKDLEDSQQGEGFRSTVESLDVMKTRLLEIAASPLFDFASDQLGGLKKWLDDNKVYVENFALAFGNMLKGLLEAIVGLGKAVGESGIFKGLLELGTSLAYVFGSTVVSLTTIIKLMTQTGGSFGSSLNGTLDNIKRFAGDPLHYKKDEGGHGEGQAGNDAQTVADIIADHDKQQRALTALAESGYAAIEGTANQNIPHVSPPNAETRANALSKNAAEAKKELDSLEEEKEKQLHDLDRKAKNSDITPQQDADQRHKVNEQWYDDLSKIVEKYEKLNALAVTKDPKGTDPKAAAADTDALIKANDHLEDVKINARKAANKAESADDEKLDDEKRKRAQKNMELLLAANKANAGQLEDLNKTQYAEGLKTTEAFYADKKKIENDGYLYAMQLLDNERQAVKGGPGTSKYSSLTDQMIGLTQSHVKSIQDASDSEPDAIRKRNADRDEQTKAYDEALIAQHDIVAETAKEAGHRNASLLALQKSLELKLEMAQLDMKSANAEQDRLLQGNAPSDTPASIQAAAAYQRARNEVTSAQLAIAKGAGDQAASQSPLMAHTAALNAEIIALTNMQDKTAEVVMQLSNLESAGQKFAAALKDVNQIAGELKNGVSDYIQGAGRGHSVLGGAGAVLSDSSITGKDGLVTGLAEKLPGMLGDSLGKMVPMIGPLIGTMFSTVSQLLSAGVQRMVDEINNKIQAIQTQASSGQIGIGQEIIELQQAKQQAINELGGSKKKGAQDQLNAILKTLNAQIGSLMFQQQQIIQNFNNMTKAGGLDTLSGTFASWYQTWDGINSQVKAYVDAGGSIATANEYLNQQLEIQRQTLTNQLTQGDQTALNDAIALNQVLTQRSELMKQEALTEFGIINSDSIERRTSAAVQAGTQLSQQRYNYQQQLLQMNEQITLDQQRLAIEGKIFDVAGTLQQLQAKSNADNIAALNQQLQQYRDMQTILNSTNGLKFSGPISNSPTANLPIPGEPSVAGAITIQQIVVNGKMSAAEANTIGTEIGKGIRSGRTSMAFSTS